MSSSPPNPGAETSDYELAAREHAAYFSVLAAREGPRLQGGGTPDGGKAQRVALRVWRLELDNILEAMDTTVRRDRTEPLLPIATWLKTYLDMAGEFMVMLRSYQVLLEAARRRGDPQLELRALLGCLAALTRTGRTEETKAVAVAAREIAEAHGDSRAAAHACRFEAITTAAPDEAAELLNRSLTICRATGDRYGELAALSSLAYVLLIQGDYASGQTLSAEVVGGAQEIGDRSLEAIALVQLGMGHFRQGDCAPALKLCNRSLGIMRELNYKGGEAAVLNNLGDLHLLRGDPLAASEAFNQGLRIGRELGSLYLEAYSLNGLGTALSAGGDFDGALPLLHQALSLRLGLGRAHDLADSLGQIAHALAGLGRRYEATLCLAGHQAAYATFSVRPHFVTQQSIDAVQAALDRAVAAGAISADELAQWQAEGEAMSLDELAEFTLAALAPGA